MHNRSTPQNAPEVCTHTINCVHTYACRTLHSGTSCLCGAHIPCRSGAALQPGSKHRLSFSLCGALLKFVSVSLRSGHYCTLGVLFAPRSIVNDRRVLMEMLPESSSTRNCSCCFYLIWYTSYSLDRACQSLASGRESSLAISQIVRQCRDSLAS
jgi:hypothetical protein